MHISRSGQVSMEYVMILAAMLLILTLLIVIFNGIYTQQALRAQYLQAEGGLSSLKAAATENWAEGNGSSQEVTIDLPPITLLPSSGFTSQSMYLNLSGFGDVSTATVFPISGSWPVQTGRTVMSVYNNGQQILIRPAGRLEINLTGFYMSFTSGTSGATYVGIRNRANVSYTLVENPTCPPAATCNFDHTGTYTLANNTGQVSYLNISSSTPGFASGYLNISATPAAGSGLPNEQFILPITINVH